MEKNELWNDDPMLFVLFKEGDELAFKDVFDHYFDRLFLIIRVFVGQEEIAEEIVTEAFIKLYDRRERIKEPDHISRFLWVVARNKAISYFRQERRQRVALKELEQLMDREYQDPAEA